jgi:hypothetical protein
MKKATIEISFEVLIYKKAQEGGEAKRGGGFKSSRTVK